MREYAIGRFSYHKMDHLQKCVGWQTCHSSCIYLVRRKHTFAISLEWYTFKLVYTAQNTPKS